MHPQPRTLMIIGALAATAVTIGGALVDTTAAAEPIIVVAPGDTLSEIALAHDVTVEQLTALNKLGDPNRIYAGQELMLEAPTREAPPPAKPAAAAPPSAPGARIHQIQPGEYLIAIAAHYGTTVEAIARANGLANPSFIRAGDRLRVPGAAPGATSTHAALPAAAPSFLHAILAGENLTGIAARYGTTVTAIARANAIADPVIHSRWRHPPHPRHAAELEGTGKSRGEGTGEDAAAGGSRAERGASGDRRGGRPVRGAPRAGAGGCLAGVRLASGRGERGGSGGRHAAAARYR